MKIEGLRLNTIFKMGISSDKLGNDFFQGKFTVDVSILIMNFDMFTPAGVMQYSKAINGYKFRTIH